MIETVGELIDQLAKWNSDRKIRVETDGGQRNAVESVGYNPAYDQALLVILCTAIDEQ